MKSELKRLAIQKGETVLSESDKNLVGKLSTVELYNCGGASQYYRYEFEESRLADLLVKVREDERERCAKQSARYYDQIAGIEIAGKIRNLK